ncbi:MAG TPA: hypothetical protein VIZ28_13945 [Chitinophagaceae bacterium]
MKNIVYAFTLLISAALHGQYYYNDIIGTREINDKMKAFVAAKVQSVTATGYDPHGVKTTDFSERQDVQANGSILKTTTRNGQSITRLYYQFDSKTRLIKSTDSTGDIQIISIYAYNDSGNLTRILTTRRDSKMDFNELEDRQWQYSADGKPKIMYRIVNGTDSTEYRFTRDEQGNLEDETLYRRYNDKDTVYYYIYENQRIYYYYDDQDRLTDIVRYNKKVKELLPDVMFQYDENNHVIQRITTLVAWPPDYLEWRYLFNDKGLKTKEALYSKSKNLKGRIDYVYSFAP